MIEIAAANPEQIAAMVQHLPEFEFKNSSEDIRIRVAGKNHSTVLARSDGADAGFMVCHEENDGSYYNRIMGVLPVFRKAGIGKALMLHFAESALLAKLPRLKVKTMNKYRSMIRLLVDCGFDITAVGDGKITFEANAQQVARSDALTRADQL